jgi:single-strand DNA-binding protein
MDTYLTVQGNLTADPTGRMTAGGATVVNFRIASSGRRFDRAAQEFRDGDPMYISVSAWRGLATNAMATLRKGDSVIVLGRLTYRTYDDKAGIRRSVHEIDAVAIGPDLARYPADLRRPARATDTPSAAGMSADAISGTTDGVDAATGEILPPTGPSPVAA